MLDKDLMIADLHIHSRFSRACSRNIDFENLVKWAKIKGLNLLGTGDFTHPVWFEEIKKLKENGKGFYYHDDFPFIITGEISLMYSQDGKSRKVHLNLLIPNIEIAEKIHEYLDKKGLRRDYDGRPIFGMSCEEFTKDLIEISKEIEVIPAHIWTPWFGVFGSKSGFDSLKQAFGEQADKIHAIETGISSDPKMNYKIKELNNKSIVSFSDAHSFWPFRLGREATIFKKIDSYIELVNQIRDNSFIGTIEVEPAYGKYHYDGHRNCNFSCDPNKTKELNGVCPVCNKPLTIGVDYRVEEIATNPKDFEPENKKLFYTLLPLHEIISLWLGAGMQSKKVWEVYNGLIKLFRDEFNILLNVSREKFLEENVDGKLIAFILKNRKGNIKVKPGYDGEYGVAQIEEEQEKLF